MSMKLKETKITHILARACTQKKLGAPSTTYQVKKKKKQNKRD